MIHRVTPSRRTPQESSFSCCGFNRKNQIKQQRSFEIKPKIMKRNISPTVTPFKNFTIIEEEITHQHVVTPKHHNLLQLHLIDFNESISTRPNTLIDHPKPYFPIPIVNANDDNVSRPLQKLKNRRKSSHISDPLSTTLNTSIRFTYAAKSPNRMEINCSSIINETTIEEEIVKMRKELSDLFAETERLKLQKYTNRERYKTLLFSLAKKQEEIKQLEALRRLQVEQLKRELETMIAEGIIVPHKM